MGMRTPPLCPHSFGGALEENMCVVFTSSHPAGKICPCVVKKQEGAQQGHLAGVSQVDVNAETLLQEDEDGAPQIHCEMARTGGVRGFRWMRKVLLLVVAWAI